MSRDIVRFLFEECGASVHTLDKNARETPLFMAAVNGHRPPQLQAGDRDL